MTTPRKPGLSALSRTTLTSAQYASHGTLLRQSQASSLATQLSVFQSLLHQFSITHAKDIRSNPTFRTEFARMCSAIGVDPLVGSHTRKGSGGGGSMWASMLGGSVNDFYFELAVRVVEVCRASRKENGGLIGVSEVKGRVEKGRGVGAVMAVSEDDIIRAVESLEPLQSGFKVVQVGSRRMIRSVAKELNTDQSVVLEAMQLLGYVTISVLQLNLQWVRPRVKAVLDDLIADSLVWVDAQASETEYWSASFIHEAGTRFP